MPAKRPRSPGSPSLTPSPPPSALTSGGGKGADLGAILPDRLEFALPHFAGMLPTNWYRPSTSAVERVTDADFETESEIAREQGNGLQLMGMNLDNVEELARNAVKATKIGKLMGEYLVGIEAMRTVGVCLRNAQTVTANEEKKGFIMGEKGRQLDIKFAGEQIKTGIEQSKSDLLSDESNYYRELRPIEQTRWQNLLEAAQIKAQQALNGRQSA
jgi:hypothetical protein